MMTESEPWYSSDYLRIAGASLHAGTLVVRFADGTSASLPVACIRPDMTGARWEQMMVTDQEITVPTAAGIIEIPWSTIRLLSDPAYSAHLARKAEEQARRIGARLRDLRESRQLSGKELAERAGITPQSLSRIEHGQHDVVFRTLQRLLTAMGYSVRDLAPLSPLPSGATPVETS